MNADAFAPFTLPLRREGDSAIVDKTGKTVLVIDPDRDLEDDEATRIADLVFDTLVKTPAPSSELAALRSRLAISRQMSSRYGDLIKAHARHSEQLLGRVAAQQLAITSLNLGAWRNEGSDVIHFTFPEISFVISADDARCATREEAPAEAGELAGAIAFLDGAAVMLGRGEMPAPGSEYAARWWQAHAVALAALRAQPQAREDAQPVGWQRRIRNTAVPSTNSKSQWSKWVDCDERQRKDTQETGGVAGFPELVAEVRPVYAQPAPNALRVVTPELAAEFANIDGPWTRGQMEMEEVWSRLIDAQLTALQAEQKGGA